MRGIVRTDPSVEMKTMLDASSGVVPYGRRKIYPLLPVPDERVLPLAEVVEVVLRRRLRDADDDVFGVLHVPVDVEQVLEHAPAVDDDADGTRIVRPDFGPVPPSASSLPPRLRLPLRSLLRPSRTPLV
ncbi:MAG: hypothetical protein KO206_09385 [Methanomicrobiaceae archaeon]|uniref:Uncharacterized protein n=1 Tax=hydrocarbon metagenome TaxID=938273 RepID=A0A0W8FHF9_9ZZZZ|nr:hypothetical protein [Methanomicrobiaceae archaeon]MDD5419027.1 hypothetical protein [Methanomicrobiaceae archaeon]